MFDIFSWQHIIIMLVVALVVVGPKDLPRLMNMAGKWAGKARAMANEFRKSFDEMARQAELDELRKEIAALRAERPLAGIEQHIEHGILPPADEVMQSKPPEEHPPAKEQGEAAKADAP